VYGIRYTVPAGYANRNVIVRLFAEHFEVLEKNGAIVFSSKYLDTTVSPTKLVINQLHFSGLQRKPRGNENYYGLQRDFIRRFPELAELIDGIKLRFKSLSSIHLNALIRLAQQYGDDALNDAGRHAMMHKRFSSDSIKSILEMRYPEKPEQPALPLNGLGGAMVGDVEEGDLDEFAILDTSESEGTPE